MRKYVAPMQAEMHSQARPLPRFEPARELRLARMCRSRRPVPREAPRSRTRVTTRRARKSRPRYSGRYAHARNAMRSAPIDSRSLRCFMFAESIPYIFQMFGTMGNLCNTKSICALCNTTSICAVFLCAIIVRAQPPAKKSVTVHLLVVFRRRQWKRPDDASGEGFCGRAWRRRKVPSSDIDSSRVNSGQARQKIARNVLIYNEFCKWIMNINKCYRSWVRSVMVRLAIPFECVNARTNPQRAGTEKRHGYVFDAFFTEKYWRSLKNVDISLKNTDVHWKTLSFTKCTQ